MNANPGAVRVMERTVDWRDAAVCRVDPDAMFPDNNEHGIEQARRVCALCPVTQECLAHALRTGDNEHGIRGGLKPSERRAVLRELRQRELGVVQRKAAV